jgi:ABC-type dipeptide/oligopeptide/nickel transport system permease component
MRNSFLIGLLCVFCCSALRAQDNSATIKKDTADISPVQIDESQLEQFRSHPDFDYEEAIAAAPDWWVSFKNWIGSIFITFFEWLFGVEKAAGAFSVFLEVLPYALLVLLLFILIKFFLSVNARAVMHAKKNQAIVALSEEEHIIKNEDIQQLIEKALGQKDYRLAVRYYYLYMLQLMSEKECIVWELQKTNEDYHNELKKQELVQPFATSTRLYNYFWYGEFPIDETKYKKAEAKFLSLKQLLLNG